MVQEAQREAGAGNNIIAEISMRNILSLEAPVEFVASPDTVYPFGLAENDWLPNVEDIKEAVKKTINF